MSGGPGADVSYMSWLGALTSFDDTVSVLLVDPASGGRSAMLATPNKGVGAWIEQSAKDLRLGFL